MNWWRRQPSSKNAPQATLGERGVLCLDDRSYYSNDDILEGMQFFATMHIRTPLSVLRHHGEFFAGPPSKTPTYGTQADGIWIFKLKQAHEFGVAHDQAEPSSASDIGPIGPSVYLPFLIQFRSIVEGDFPHDEQLARLVTLANSSNAFKEIWSKLSTNYGDFPASFFYYEFTELPGIGRRLAKRLYDDGFRSTREIIYSSAARLMAIQGLGATTAAKIKAVQLPRRAHGA